MVASIEQIIKAHNQAVSSCPQPPEGVCVRCLKKPPSFKLHDSRLRTFRFIVETMVQVMEAILVRWKCSLCKKTFTDYPPFAIPYKRYVRNDLLRICREYLEEEQGRQSYESVAGHKGSSIAYDGQDDTKPCFAPSTPWNWLGWLGSLAGVLEQALERIRSKDPNNGIFGRHFRIAGRKYRSERRKRLLEIARRLLEADHVFRELFGDSVFPGFASPYRYH